MGSRDTQRYELTTIRHHTQVGPGTRVLEMGYYDPIAALWAAGQGANVLALRPNVDLVAELDQRAREARLTTLEARIALRPEPGERGTFDVALLLAPFFLGNAPVRDAIHTAATALKPDGTLLFQVHRRHGGDTFVRMAREVFGQVEQVDVGSGQRRLMQATEPRAEAVPVEVETKEAPLHELVVGGATLQFRLAAGVFGHRGIDPATKLLIATVEVPGGGTALDLGCGAGIIGLAVAARDRTTRVTLVDSSQPAVELAQENAERNGLKNADVKLGDGYGAVRGRKFDAILSNLPAHRGVQAESETAERFIAGAAAHLRSNGVAWFVANKALPYELPASRTFRSVRVVATDGRYKVLECRDAG